MASIRVPGPPLTLVVDHWSEGRDTVSEDTRPTRPTVVAAIARLDGKTNTSASLVGASGGRLCVGGGAFGRHVVFGTPDGGETLVLDARPPASEDEDEPDPGQAVPVCPKSAAIRAFTHFFETGVLHPGFSWTPAGTHGHPYDHVPGGDPFTVGTLAPAL